MSRRRVSRTISVDVDVDIDYVLDELDDDDLIEELERRGQKAPTKRNGEELTADTLRQWADDIERGRVGEVARALRLMAFEMQPALDVAPLIGKHPFLRFPR